MTEPVEPPVEAPGWTRSGPIRGTRVLVQAGLVFPVFNLLFGMEIRHRERLQHLHGAAIFVSNHSSALDAVAMIRAMPGRFRNRSYVVAAADSIFKRRWEALIAEMTVNAYPIPRGGGARPALEQLKHHIRHGWSVVIFPEGTLSRTGRIGTFRKGAAILAIDTGVPIVPAYIEGTFELLPRFRRLPHPAQGSLTWGDPLYPQAGEDYDAFIGRTEQAVRTLAGPRGMERDEPAPTGAASAEGSNYWY
ncbi:MAG TPA: lysophospholipid acyltransferase family protein [Candidatus Limnocylindrales bacterium]|nr:lysophospholipid acyltransferase family protein [Candidatus Limnocylindrales bacterium]